MSGRAHITIPVFIDSVKHHSEIVRSMYFLVEAIEPAEAVLSDLNLPCLAFGPSAILYSPIDEEFFTTPESIEQLFRSIDERPQLVVDTEEIWLPNDVFPPERKPLRGDVYRLGIELFHAASDYGFGRCSRKALTDQVRKRKLRVSHSEIETTCFLAWGQRRIDEAKENYLRQQENNLNLRYDQSDSPRRKIMGR